MSQSVAINSIEYVVGSFYTIKTTLFLSHVSFYLSRPIRRAMAFDVSLFIIPGDGSLPSDAETTLSTDKAYGIVTPIYTRAFSQEP